MNTYLINDGKLLHFIIRILIYIPFILTFRKLTTYSLYSRTLPLRIAVYMGTLTNLTFEIFNLINETIGLTNRSLMYNYWIKSVMSFFTVGVIAQTAVTFCKHQMALFDLSLNQKS